MSLAILGLLALSFISYQRDHIGRAVLALSAASVLLSLPLIATALAVAAH